MDREQALRKIEELKEFIEKGDNEIDFSKWIRRDGDVLAIKGKVYLKSLPNASIHYSNNSSQLFIDKVNYEVVTWADLKPGDVFIEDEIQGPYLHDFNIFAGVDSNQDYRIQYLITNGGIEYIDNVCHGNRYKTEKVKRFLRE